MALNNQQKLLVAISGEVQAVEDAIQQVQVGHWIDEAVGLQLDILGKLVGQLRGGFDDATYRRLIRAKISVNRSKGTIEDLITVAQLVVDDDTVTYEVDNQGDAVVVLRLLTAAVPDDVAELALMFLKKTVAGGVRIILEWSSDPPADWFIWGVSDWNEKKWADGDE